MAEVFRPQASEKRVRLVFPEPHQSVGEDGSTGPLPKLIGDERRFQQVLINLIKNALKFTTAGSITVKSRYDFAQQTLIVAVRDTGAGIVKED